MINRHPSDPAPTAPAPTAWDALDPRWWQSLHRSQWELLSERFRLLPISPDGCVLEIAPATVISTALLARAVVPKGRVIATFTNPTAAAEARHLLYEQLKVRNVTALQVDEHEHGAPDRAPDDGYDAVLAWGSWPHLPDAWVKQTTPGGLLAVSMYLAPFADATGLCQIHGDPTGELAVHLLPGEPSPYDPCAKRLPAFLDGIDLDPSGIPTLVSGPWLRPSDPTDPAQTAAATDRTQGLLATLHRQDIEVQPSWALCSEAGLDPFHESLADLRVWALLTEPEQLTTAAYANLTGWFGYANSDGLCLLHTATGCLLSAGNHRPATAQLAALAARWKAAGQPGWDDLTAELTPVPGGCRLRTEVARPPTSNIRSAFSPQATGPGIA